MVHTRWIILMPALTPVGFALNEITFTLQGYLADSYTIYASSAFAGGLSTRCLLIAAVLPFTHDMYTEITAKAAALILAAVGTLFCVSPYVLLRHRKSIRKTSKFSQYS